MRCENIEKLIAAYADGELEGMQKDLVKAHLEKCPHCAALYREYLALNDALSDCTERAPDDLCDKVMAAIREEKAAPAVKSRGVVLGKAAPWIGVGVAAMLCVSVATTALVRHMVGNAGHDVEVLPPYEQAPGTQASTEDGIRIPESADPEASPDDNAVPEQTTESATYEEITTEAHTTSAGQTTATEQEPEYDQTTADSTASPEQDSDKEDERTESETQAPADSELETQPVPDGEEQTQAPSAEAGAKGWLGRLLEAIGEFFAHIFDAVASFFGGDRRA